MSRRVGILQSNYIPWKGYFDLINLCDEFILFDDVQFTRRDWRNRNRIKTQHGARWLTIPVAVKGRFDQAIRDVVVRDQEWRRAHWESLRHSYSKAPHFGDYSETFEALYLDADEMHLSDINRTFLEAICGMLGIDTTITTSMQYGVVEGKNERLIDLCQKAGATNYLSGPAARDYLDESLFADAGVQVEWMDYSGYPEYVQPYPPFDHSVSVVDLLFSTGPQAPNYMKSFGT